MAAHAAPDQRTESTMNYYNYFTEIEEHFVRRRGKHLLVSPMDWGLIASWRDAGVPLQVAIRGIDIAMDSFFAQARKHSRPNSLCYCHDSVMREYASHLEAHLGESPEGAERVAESDDELDAGQTAQFLIERIGEIKAAAAKQSPQNSGAGVGRAAARLEEILQGIQAGGRIDSEALERDLSIVDELLAAELRALVPPERFAEWEKEAKKELKVYRKRLPKETYEKIHGNFLRDRIRREFHIGELSLFRL